MGLIKTGIVLYGAYLAAEKIYGEKGDASAGGGWSQRSQAAQAEAPRGTQKHQSPPPNYAPRNNSQGPPQPYQQWPGKAAIEAEGGPRQCTCGAAHYNQANDSYGKN